MTDTRPENTSPRRLFLIGGGAALVLALGAGILFGYRFLTGPASISNPPYAPNTACDHPFFPLRPGAVWRYRGETVVNDSDPVPTIVTWRVENVSGDLAAAVAVVIVEYDYDDGGFLVLETVEYNCSSDGLRRANSIVATGVQTINQFVKTEGFYIPAQVFLESRGSTWRHRYTVISNYEPPGSDFDWRYEVAGFEDVEDLPADIEAVKVEGVRVASGVPEEITTAEWFAFGVGQVRSRRVQTEVENVVTSDLTLVQMTLP